MARPWGSSSRRRRLDPRREALAFSLPRIAADQTAGGVPSDLDSRTGAVLVHSRADETWDPPVRLTFTDADLRSHLRRLSAGAAGNFSPDVPVMQAAYQLFLIHLDETLATRAVAGCEVTLADDGPVCRPEREPEEWALPEPGEHLVYTSPEQWEQWQAEREQLGDLLDRLATDMSAEGSLVEPVGDRLVVRRRAGVVLDPPAEFGADADDLHYRLVRIAQRPRRAQSRRAAASPVHEGARSLIVAYPTLLAELKRSLVAPAAAGAVIDLPPLTAEW